MKIAEVIAALENWAPPQLQEEYDNAGLIVGDKQQECDGILVSLDVTEEIVVEAKRKNCNLIVAHHPIIFKGIKKLNGKDFVERTVIFAIKNDIAIYAIHTNLDNVSHGVNAKLASLFHLKDCKVLLEKENHLRKLITFAPLDVAEKIRTALFEGGAGAIGKYNECSFNIEGKGTFKAGEDADPFVGEIGERHSEKEVRIEVIFPTFTQNRLMKKLREAHPYEEIAYYISPLLNTESDTGSGLVGTLENEMEEQEFLFMVKNVLKVPVIKHTKFLNKKIKKVAICGGAGFFLLPVAKAAKADVFLTSDIKYHEYFEADSQILLADVGHFESEQFTIELLANFLQEKFLNFAVLKTELSTNPVQYLI